MIARYLARRVIGVLIRLGRTLQGQERPNTPKTHTCLSGSVIGPHRATQEVES